MKIIELRAENVKRLKAVAVRPNGNLVQITGANGSGKSSLLDSIFFAFAGASGIPSQPVRQGTQKALIRVDLGEFIVTRRFTQAGGTSLVVEQANGARFPSPQRMLDELLGALTFDPLAFSRQAPKQQLETLRALVPVDVDIDALDRANAADYAERTEINRRLRSLAERVETLGRTVDPNMDVALVDIAGLVDQLQAAMEHNTAIDLAKKLADDRARQIDECERVAREKRAMAEQLLEEAQVLEERAGELRERMAHASPIPEPIDPSAVRQRIGAAQQQNAAKEAQLRNRALHQEALAALTATREQADALTLAIDARHREKAEAIARAPMPVPGLSFGAGEVLYNGLPFDQASSAEQLKVSVAIAMAANPKLRVLRIKDGSLLDDTSLGIIADMAEAQDYQVWIEKVDTSGKVGIVMVDGEVLGAELDAEEASEDADAVAEVSA